MNVGSIILYGMVTTLMSLIVVLIVWYIVFRKYGIAVPLYDIDIKDVAKRYGEKYDNLANESECIQLYVNDSEEIVGIKIFVDGSWFDLKDIDCYIKSSKKDVVLINSEEHILIDKPIVKLLDTFVDMWMLERN